jgi:hypothetical protein
MSQRKYVRICRINPETNAETVEFQEDGVYYDKTHVFEGENIRVAPYEHDDTAPFDGGVVVEVPEEITEVPEVVQEPPVVPETVEEIPEEITEVPEVVQETPVVPETVEEIPEEITEVPEVVQETPVVPETVEEIPEEITEVPEVVQETPVVPETVEEIPEEIAEVPEVVPVISPIFVEKVELLPDPVNVFNEKMRDIMKERNQKIEGITEEVIPVEEITVNLARVKLPSSSRVRGPSSRRF